MERYETKLPIYLVIAMLRIGLEDQKKVKCETSYREINEKIHEKHLRTQTRINNLNKVKAEWKKC